MFDEVTVSEKTSATVLPSMVPLRKETGVVSSAA